MSRHLAAACLILCALAATAQESPPPTYDKPLGIAMDEWPYPWPVHYLPLTAHGRDHRMAYMDVAPTATANGRAVLLHNGAFAARRVG